MAAPEFVPVRPTDDVRAYESPPRRPDPWWAARPGDLTGGQPQGDARGWQGPDQGYALRLARAFRGQVKPGRLTEDDVLAGCLGVALKRASLFGRAPIAQDWKVALEAWGFLTDAAPADLVRRREELFAGLAHPHHDDEKRIIVDQVPEDVLKGIAP